MIKKIYKEAPYIDYEGGEKIFDLELENFKSGDDLIKFLDSIFKGELKQDKYGNKIELKDRQQKAEFLNNMYNDPIFKNLINKLLSGNEKKLLSFILGRDL